MYRSDARDQLETCVSVGGEVAHGFDAEEEAVHVDRRRVQALPHDTHNTPLKTTTQHKHASTMTNICTDRSRNQPAFAPIASEHSRRTCV